MKKRFRFDSTNFGWRNDIEFLFQAFFVEDPANSSAVVGDGHVKEGGFGCFEDGRRGSGGGSGIGRTNSSLATGDH